jgi:hypothetical protein
LRTDVIYEISTTFKHDDQQDLLLKQWAPNMGAFYHYDYEHREQVQVHHHGMYTLRWLACSLDMT